MVPPKWGNIVLIVSRLRESERFLESRISVLQGTQSLNGHFSSAPSSRKEVEFVELVELTCDPVFAWEAFFLYEENYHDLGEVSSEITNFGRCFLSSLNSASSTGSEPFTQV